MTSTLLGYPSTNNAAAAAAAAAALLAAQQYFSLNNYEQQQQTTVVSNTVNNNSGAVVGTKLLKCKQCAFTCYSKEEYWQHQRSQHIKPEKLLECSKCSFVTEYRHHLEYHMRNHAGQKPFKCMHCDYTCINMSMLRSHLKSHASKMTSSSVSSGTDADNTALYFCADCSYSSKYLHGLKLHMEKFKHRRDKNRTVKATSVSPNSSSSSSSSSSYSLPHNNEQPHFTTGDLLQQLQLAALLTSTNNHQHQPMYQFMNAYQQALLPQFKCVLCNVNFENKKELVKHAKAYHEEDKNDHQLYECVKCELLFRNYDMYTSHKRLHDTST